jgi:hypothetical protein
MEYVFVNDWYIYWFATITLLAWTSIVWLLFVGVVFVTTVVYDIYKQVTLKWSKK